MGCFFWLLTLTVSVLASGWFQALFVLSSDQFSTPENGMNCPGLIDTLSVSIKSVCHQLVTGCFIHPLQGYIFTLEVLARQGLPMPGSQWQPIDCFGWHSEAWKLRNRHTLKLLKLSIRMDNQLVSVNSSYCNSITDGELLSRGSSLGLDCKSPAIWYGYGTKWYPWSYVFNLIQPTIGFMILSHTHIYNQDLCFDLFFINDSGFMSMAWPSSFVVRIGGGPWVPPNGMAWLLG